MRKKNPNFIVAVKNGCHLHRHQAMSLGCRASFHPPALWVVGTSHSCSRERPFTFQRQLFCFPLVLYPQLLLLLYSRGFIALYKASSMSITIILEQFGTNFVAKLGKIPVAWHGVTFRRLASQRLSARVIHQSMHPLKVNSLWTHLSILPKTSTPIKPGSNWES